MQASRHASTPVHVGACQHASARRCMTVQAPGAASSRTGVWNVQKLLDTAANPRPCRPRHSYIRTRTHVHTPTPAQHTHTHTHARRAQQQQQQQRRKVAYAEHARAGRGYHTSSPSTPAHMPDSTDVPVRLYRKGVQKKRFKKKGAKPESTTETCPGACIPMRC